MNYCSLLKVAEVTVVFRVMPIFIVGLGRPLLLYLFLNGFRMLCKILLMFISGSVLITIPIGIFKCCCLKFLLYIYIVVWIQIRTIVIGFIQKKIYYFNFRIGFSSYGNWIKFSRNRKLRNLDHNLYSKTVRLLTMILRKANLYLSNVYRLVLPDSALSLKHFFHSD